ncbi:hypothetical protein PMEGAS70_47800 [Priestia megaterium]|uniref:Uncharacterized protein n=1 Tax=Priestia megaterium TaxID=1404 RepID=A0AAX6BEG6_PRIMG|nr:hypothetical protein ShirakiTB12_06000 [Priestia megaterium]
MCFFALFSFHVNPFTLFIQVKKIHKFSYESITLHINIILSINVIRWNKTDKNFIEIFAKEERPVEGC